MDEPELELFKITHGCPPIDSIAFHKIFLDLGAALTRDNGAQNPNPFRAEQKELAAFGIEDETIPDDSERTMISADIARSIGAL
ncbi:hypothetical protein [uncultured Roseovarius sp.]|uniref:hypothetical protein n=1 Tax=uncultured Roseovarius sp. TaxID=293344 RepID=UPI0025D0F657|nr:hypothetical protein [uncultured Roseovarius sp.]